MSPTKRSSQRGAALLTAMVIVTLIATLTVGMIWQQWRAIQVEAAERTQIQARWVLDGALDWARLILREDARSGGADHLGEPWAVELKEARLSTFLAADKDNTDDAPEAFLSGQIRDAQARFNLGNLVREGKFHPKDAEALSRLCELAGSSSLVAQRITAAIRLAYPGATTEVGNNENSASGAGTASGKAAGTTVVSTTAAQNVPIIPTRLSDLTWLGIDAASVALLEPYLVILPRATPVNLNTASKEVIAAVVPDAGLAGAQRLVQSRTLTPLKNIEDARTALGVKALDPAAVSVRSNYFEVDGSLRLDQLIVSQRSLLERAEPPRLEVKTLRSDRVSGARNPANALQQ